ncbi:MAG: hypothetical protein ACJ0GR_04960 [Prochlorococcaceae cyanobacterium]
MPGDFTLQAPEPKTRGYQVALGTSGPRSGRHNEWRVLPLDGPTLHPDRSPPTDGCDRYQQARQKPALRESSYRSPSLRILSALDPTHPRVLLNDI